MPQIPHQYTVRQEAANEADYRALHDAIRTHGVVEFWHDGKVNGDKPIRRGRGRPMRYLYPGGGWRYWYMRIPGEVARESAMMSPTIPISSRPAFRDDFARHSGMMSPS